MPYQLMIAATPSSSFGWHSRSRPAEPGTMPVVRARCPPAELPVTTMRDVSKPYCSALLFTQCSAQRQSSTAAGRARDASEPVLHVDHRPTLLQPGEQPQDVAFLAAADPAAAVDVHQHGRRTGRVARQVEIHAIVEAVRDVIRHVGNHAVLVGDVRGPRRGLVELGDRRGRREQKGAERQETGEAEESSGHAACLSLYARFINPRAARRSRCLDPTMQATRRIRRRAASISKSSARQPDGTAT